FFMGQTGALYKYTAGGTVGATLVTNMGGRIMTSPDAFRMAWWSGNVAALCAADLNIGYKDLRTTSNNFSTLATPTTVGLLQGLGIPTISPIGGYVCLRRGDVGLMQIYVT